jgi:hypothetical protein
LSFRDRDSSGDDKTIRSNNKHRLTSNKKITQKFENSSQHTMTIPVRLWWALLFCALISSDIAVLGLDEKRSDDVEMIPPPTPYNTREERFPPMEERVKIYMSNWYTPPCEDNKEAFIKYKFVDDDNSTETWPTLQIHGLKGHALVNQTNRIMDVENIVEPDKTFFMSPEIIVHCANYSYEEKEHENENDPIAERIMFRLNMRMYCIDVQNLLLPALSHIELEQRHLDTEMPPTLLQFGDNKQSHDYGEVMVPHIKKFRSAALSPQDLQDVTPEECWGKSTPRPALDSHHGDFAFQPIVWKFATDRHYRHLYEVYRMDTVWSKKKNMAVFRGQLTGSRDGYDKRLNDEENCLNLKRCRLVYNHANSTLVHARLTSTRGRLPDVLNGVELVGEKVRLQTLLEYKGIVMIEGNDVASGLKWALLSQSIVLMPPPKHTSWAMEELLQPWVHYVPLDDVASDVEERMQWVVDHDEEAQRISERATLWMEDLVFHPDAAEDDRLIQEEILRRYQKHFKPFK